MLNFGVQGLRNVKDNAKHSVRILHVSCRQYKETTEWTRNRTSAFFQGQKLQNKNCYETRIIQLSIRRIKHGSFKLSVNYYLGIFEVRFFLIFNKMSSSISRDLSNKYFRNLFEIDLNDILRCTFSEIWASVFSWYSM